MNEEGVRNLDHEALGTFRSSFTRRYEQWKRGDLFSIAVQTMPKQVRKSKVIDNLLELKSERAKRLKEEI